LCEAEAPSEVRVARGRLDRFNISVVESVTLRVSVRDVVPDELLLDCDDYVSRSILPGAGPIRLARATYYCTRTDAADYYRMGTAARTSHLTPRDIPDRSANAPDNARLSPASLRRA